jgi:hypothetical protein
MNNPKPFYRFEDNQLRPFAVEDDSGIQPLTNRAKKALELNSAYVNGLFGFYPDQQNNPLPRFANDSDWQETDVRRLAPVSYLQPLNPKELKAVEFLSALVSGIDNLFDSDDIITLANDYGFSVSGYTTLFTEIDAYHVEIGLLSDQPLRGFRLLFEFQTYQSAWVCQWFIQIADTSIDVLFNEYSPKTLPLPADVDAFKWETAFVDFDFVEFLEQTNDEPFYMPAKPGDKFQFNVIPELANISELANYKIGIIDCNQEVVFQDVGSAEQLKTCYKIQLPYFSGALFPEQEFISWTAFVDNYLDKDLTFFTSNIPENATFEEIADGLIDELVILDGGTITSYDPQDFINAVLSLYWPYNYEVTGTIIETDAGEGVELSICSPICAPVNSISARYQFSLNVAFFTLQVDFCQNPTCKTQLFSKIQIPFSIPDGLYKFYLYDIEGKVYSFSNPFQIDRTDEFSQILTFQGNGITEGFEYYDNWFQQVRIGLQSGAPEPSVEQSTYRDSLGRTRRPFNKSDLFLALHTNYIDQLTMEALNSATLHPVFVLGGQNLFVSETLEISHNQDFSNQTSYMNLFKVKGRANIQNYQPNNQGCINC